MSYSEPDDNETFDEVEPQGGIKAAREAAERNAAKAAERDTLARELAIVKALPGVDLNGPLGTMFIGSYDGKLDKDAIEAQARAIGLISEPVEPPPPETDPTDVAAQAAREGLGTGLTATPATPEEEALALHPKDRALAKFNEAKQRGLPMDRAAGQYFDEMVSAAMAGDKRASWEGWSPDQLAGLT